MEKASKWLKSLLTGQKEKHKKKERDGETPLHVENPSTPITISTPKQKRRWSFGRPAKDSNSKNPIAAKPVFDSVEQKKVVEFDDALIRVFPFTARKSVSVEEVAAIKIQAFFRSYLAKKALRALKGIVKLQSLVRGHLVRRQATATLRCMQALVTVQARAVAHRIRMAEEAHPVLQRQSIYRKLQHDNQYSQLYETERIISKEENIKNVEMDISEPKGSSKSKKSYSNQQKQQAGQRLSRHYAVQLTQHPKLDYKLQISPPPSTITDMSPRTFSGRFEHHSFFSRERSSPQYFSAMPKYNPLKGPFGGHHLESGNSISAGPSGFPNYMAKTESSRAKVRSHSAPKQRPPSRERQQSKQRSSVDGRNALRGVKIQRSSQGSSSADGYRQERSVKLDNTAVSLKTSECGSTITVLRQQQLL